MKLQKVPVITGNYKFCVTLSEVTGTESIKMNANGVGFYDLYDIFIKHTNDFLAYETYENGIKLWVVDYDRRR
jgi:hypothetical protein